jgi:polyhydroxybutyrate depolymerase
MIDLEIGGRVRSYRLTVPESVDGAGPVALVVDLHGLTADPSSQEDLSSMGAKGIEEGFVVAQPLGLGLLPSWSAGNNSVAAEDVAFVAAVVADVSALVPIDPARVFASGFSNGGGMANRLACNAAAEFAAIATVSGSYIEHLECDPVRAVPVVAFHGTADPVVPYDGFAFLPEVAAWAEAWASRNGCAAPADETEVAPDVTLRSWSGCRDEGDVLLYTIMGGGHGWPGTTSADRIFASTRSIVATDVIWRFFEDHPLGT